MRTAIVLTLLSLAGAVTIPRADRMTDRDLKTLVERIDDGRDRFEGALDDQIKNTVLRSATGELNVKRYLDDFDENVDRIKERLKPDYSASAEVGTLLEQASAIERFMRAAPGRRGESEWNRLSSDLKTLAVAYGADFPLPTGASVRRLSRTELSQAANDAARAADQFKKALEADLKKDTSVDAAMRKNIVAEADQLKKDAEALRSRINDDQLSSGEATRLFERAKTLEAFVAGRTLPTASAAWAQGSSRLQVLQLAYGQR